MRNWFPFWYLHPAQHLTRDLPYRDGTVLPYCKFKNKSKMKKRVLHAPALLVALVLCFNTTQAQQKSNSGSKGQGTTLNVTTNRSDATSETQIDYVEDGHRYKIRMKDSSVQEMYVDDKKLSPEEYSKYEPVVKKILDQIEKDRQQAELDREQARRDRAQAEQDRKQAERDREQATRDRQQAQKDREQAQRDREQAAIDRQKAAEDRKQLQALLDEVVKEKLVESRESLTSMELDDEKFLINGKEQPQNMHNRYKQKYLKESHNRIRYQTDGGRKTLTLN